MLFRLSLRNAKRQASEYLIYFITLVLVAMTIYAFNGLVDSKEIRELSDTLQVMPAVIIGTTAIIVLIAGWLVSYTMRFMLAKRGREFGTYLLLGIEKKQVVKLFFLENAMVGAAAFVLGALLGNLLYQGLRAIIMGMFQQEYHLRFNVSLVTLPLTVLYFLLIFLFALWRSGRYIRKSGIWQLLSMDRENERGKNRKEKTRRKLFAVSVVLFIAGAGITTGGNFLMAFAGAVLIIISTYLFFMNFSCGIPAYFDRRPTKKFKGTNLLVTRFLTSKMSTLGRTLAGISILLMGAVISMGIGIVFLITLQRNVELYTNFDLFVSSTDFRYKYEDMREYLTKHVGEFEEYEYVLYEGDGNQVTEFRNKLDHGAITYEKDMFMKLSDYNRLRGLMDLDHISVEQGECIVHCLDYLEEDFEKYKKDIHIGNETMRISSIYSESFTQYLYSGNGEGFIIVAADEVLEARTPYCTAFAAMCDKKITGRMFADMQEGADAFSTGLTNSSIGAPTTMFSRDVNIEDQASGQLLYVLPLFYFSLILVMAAATILTTQLLSESNVYRERFALLHKLGQSREEMKQSIRRQWTLFYGLPAIPTLVLGTYVIWQVARVMVYRISLGFMQTWGVIGIALGMFLVFYLSYIVVAYISFTKATLPEEKRKL